MHRADNERRLLAALKRQGDVCAYCKRPISYHSFGGDMATWDEIVPRSKGGRRDISNRVIACLHCNQLKRDRDVHDIFPHFDAAKWTLPAKPFLNFDDEWMLDDQTYS